MDVYFSSVSFSSSGCNDADVRPARRCARSNTSGKITKTFTVSATPTEAPGEGEDDLISALINLGYKEAAAKAAARRVSKEHAGSPFATKIREALKLVRG